MSINRFNAKRDANEPEIVECFVKAGISVESIDTPCDLLLGYANNSYLVEIKMPKGSYTQKQKIFNSTWKGQRKTIRTIDEAMDLIKEIKDLNNKN